MSKPSSDRAKGLVRAISPMPRRRALMLAGVSVLALTAAAPRVDARPLGGGSLPAVSAPAAALVAAQAAAMQSAQQANASMLRATQAIQAMQQIQQQARNAGPNPTLGSVPNGLVSGGLVPDSGLAGNGQANQVTSWTGALTPVQTKNGSQTGVFIVQTQNKAILNWNSFNVGSNTVVNFVQQDLSGVRTDWVALNRINDPSGVPSQILGQINAPGSVYIINRNGIIFGGGSQVNVTGLIASSLDVGALGMTQQQRDAFFINNGITSPFSFSINGTDGLGANTQTIGGNIEVDAGASITTALTAQDSPGFIYLFGANVTNNGTLTSPAGEVGMVAARTVTLTPLSYRSGVLPTDPLNPANAVTFRGTGFNFSQYALNYTATSGANNGAGIGKYLAGTGTVTQGGLIDTTRGTALMAGNSILMSGVISADTSVTRNSNVLLDAITSVNVSGTISIQPDENGDSLPFLNGVAAANTNTSSNVQAFIPGFVFMGGYDVTLARSALISAPSATVKLQATALAANLPVNDAGGNFQANVDQTAVPQRVLLAPGATIDVAGLQNVELPASSNFLAYTPTNADFADTPLLRNGALVGQTLYIDIRASGTRGDGSIWLGTQLGNANGYVDNVPQSIDVLMTKGGTVSLSTDTTGTVGLRDIVLQSGSLINVAGGSVQYLPGNVPLTILIGADGRRNSTANADPNMTYVGIAGQFTVDHARWNVTENFADPLSTSQYQQGYIQGSDAGGISITTVNPVLDGDFLFGAMAGARQIANGQQPSTTLTNGAPSQTTPYELPSQGYLQLTTASSVVVDSGSAVALPQNFTPTTPLPQVTFAPVPTDLFVSASPYRTDLSAASLSGLSALIITASDIVMPQGNEIDTALGGRVIFKTAGAMDLQGRIVAHSGQIFLNTDGYDLVTGASGTDYKVSLVSSGKANIADIRIGGVLDTSGLWVNDAAAAAGLATGPAFINGGNISITTNNFSSPTFSNRDATGSIFLSATSVLDADSGGYVDAKGKLKSSAYQVPSGTGGNITLAVYQGASFSPTETGGPFNSTGNEKYANVLIDPSAIVRSYGFTNDGQLLIAAPLAIQIGGAQNAGANLWLPSSLFAAGGFSQYTIQSVADGRESPVNFAIVNSTSITLAAGQNLSLQQQNFSIAGAILSNLPTGTDIAQAASLVTLPVDQRLPTSLILGSDYILLDKGSSINADPLATIILRGTQNAGTSPITYNKGISALLLGQIGSHGGIVNVTANHIWLGPNALIDVSGTLLPSSTFEQIGGASVSGTLLAGGSVTLDASLSTQNASEFSDYLVGQSGATINVSGAGATLQGIGSNSGPVESWSDGGTVSITTPVLLWDGTFLAKAGAPLGNDGTLIVGGGQVYLSQSVTTTPSNPSSISLHAALAALPTPASANALGNTFDPSLAPLTTGLLATGSNGAVHLTIDKLAQFGTIFLYNGFGMNPAEYFSILNPAVTTMSGSATALNLLTVGNINWTVGQRLYLGAQAIIPYVPANAPATVSTVNIAAAYILLTTWGQSTAATATAGSGTLNIDGDTIDIEGAVFSGTQSPAVPGAKIAAVVSGFNSVTLDSTGDIRLSTPHVFNGSTNTFIGSLKAPNNLLLQAQRTYPVTKVDFTIQAPSVAFLAPAGSGTTIPLSAGGSVTVLGTTITQDGNLFAPLGKITLGDNTAVTVTLGAGSLTSVALTGTVPYGTTEDGTNWYYYDSTNPLSVTLGSTDFLPTKVITLSGQNVSLQSTSTVDVSGGGDLQANEFVSGKGGSVDTLVTKSGQPTVYALLPSNSAAVAAFDIDFIFRLGDIQPLAGQQIYLSGGNGIAAGTYTLLPAHYATLPGAMRVVDYGSGLATPYLAGVAMPDGTQIISGYKTQSTNPGGRSSGTELFAVQTNAVWRQYSEIDATTANSYFYAQAVQNSVNVPYLPMDAGRLAISAQASLTMNVTARDTAQPGGRPGQLDLSASQIDLIGPGQTAQSGYLGIDVTQINGFDSVLIGGLRTDRANGTTLINAVASEILVDTGGAALTAPELILIATPSVGTSTLSQTFTVNNVADPFSLNGVYQGPAAPGTGNIVVNAGSVISATGLTGNTFARSYVTSTTAADLAAALGGTLSTDGTQITGVKITALLNAPATNDPTSIDGMLRNYSAAKGFGALLTLTNDPLLSIGNLTGQNSGPLTISFVNASTGAAITQKLVLPGSNSTNNGANPNPGSLSIGNAVLSAQSITLNATSDTGAITVGSTARFNATWMNLIARNFAFDNSAAASAAVVLTTAAFNQLANGHNLSLTAFGGGIDIYGDVALDSSQSSLGVTLDAAWLADHGGTAQGTSIGSAGTVTLQDSEASGTTSQTTTAGTSLTVNANEVDFGGGSQTIAGFAAVNLNAATRVFARNAGSLTLGVDSTGVGLAITTPVLLVGARTSSGVGSQFLITTAGDVMVVRPSGAVAAPSTTTENGGALEIDANSFTLGRTLPNGTVLGGTVQAQAGTLVIHTTGTDSGGNGITLVGDSYIAAGGFQQSFFDVVNYLPGGRVTLTADTGNVFTAASSTIDVSQPIGGLGYGGEFDVTATAGNALLNGNINGAGGAGHGGTFRVDALALGATNALDSLADLLLAGGINNEIDIHTHQGNLTLSAGYTLQAHTISIVADTTITNVNGNVIVADTNLNGNLTIAGIIDARGEDATTSDGTNEAGGQVGLFGANSVTLVSGGQILASTSHADERGGDVTIGVSLSAPWNAATHVGGINLVSGSVIDVSGGTKGGLSGGTLTLRAPNDGNNDVKIQAIGSTIKGARAVDVEDFISIDTVAASTSTSPTSNNTNSINGSSLGWDGVIDPAGWFGSNGLLVPGSFTGINGYKFTVTAGSGFTSVPTLTFSAITGSTTVSGLTFSGVVASLKVVSISVPAGSGGEYSSVPSVTFTAPSNAGLSGGGALAAATVNAGLKTIAVANGPTGVTNGATVTIAGGGGTGATGTAIVTNGVLIGVKITAAGSNFTGTPTSLSIGSTTVTTGISAHFTINSVSVTAAGQGYVGVVTPTVVGGTAITAATFSTSMGLAVSVTSPGSVLPTNGSLVTITGGGGTGAQVLVTSSTSLTGSINSSGAFVNGTSAGNNLLINNGLLPNGVLTMGEGLAAFKPTTANTLHTGFYGSFLETYAEGGGTPGIPGKSYGFGNAQSRLATYLQPGGATGSVNVQPGLDLINSSTSVNNGDITVASNWNLAAGNAYAVNSNGSLTALTATTTSFYSSSDPINFLYRLGIQPGTLSLRAVHDVNINASISDGFFEFYNTVSGNVLVNGASESYATYLLNYLKANGRYLGEAGITTLSGPSTGYDDYLNSVATLMPSYLPAANGISPAGSALADADVFPSTLPFCISSCTTAKPVLQMVQNPGSWSYRITAGADIASANPNATSSTYGVDASGANKANGNVIFAQHSTYNTQEAASVAINVMSLTTVVVNLPTMLRTGTGGIDIAAANNLQLTDPLAPGTIYTAGVNSAPLPNANLSGTAGNLSIGNPAGFVEPQVLLANVRTSIFGPEDAAAFPQMGGDITINVGQDVIGFQNVKSDAQTSSVQQFAQFYTPWLLSTAETNNVNGDLLLGSGVFQPSATAPTTEQSAWWIQFGSFDQGVMSVGGNVTLTAGRDVRDFSISLPTTGRVSGGLSQLANGQPNTPVPYVYGSGNMTVSVGRELDSGTFYEGSGHASILVRGSVTSDWQSSYVTGTTTTTVPAATVLAVDSGQIALYAGGSISTVVVNPAAIRKQFLGTVTTAYEMQTYGPDSAVRMYAGGGDVSLVANPFPLSANLYPASLELVAFTGSINTSNSVTLADSPGGSLDLLAADDINLGSGSISQASGISTGASLIDQAFDPYAPDDGFDASSSSPLLAHGGDHGLNHVYAVNGTIQTRIIPPISGATTTIAPSTALADRLESNRPIVVRAGTDIIDLNLVAQNVNLDDVSSVIAGRDISYTGNLNAGGLQIAGPGFLLVEAGRNLGPFLPLAHDTSAQALFPEGIQSVGNNGIVTSEGTVLFAFPVGNEPNILTTFAPPNPEFLGQQYTGTAIPNGCSQTCWSGIRNFLLPETGASIVAMFGVAKGINYQGVIDTYVDPANAATVPHNYLDELRKFLAGLGRSTIDQADAWAQFQTLSPQLQLIFADQVYFAELKATGIPGTPSYQQYQRGYEAVNIMFPADVSADGLYGYTRNALGGGTNGANVLVPTGNFNLLHATVQTQRGGDISILGPGGSILAGSVATEPNANLKLNDLGILTLAGGDIDTFTDQSVLVNASRVMTWFGGDILMWSSNGDIDAGRGAKTTLSFPPLKVDFDPDDLETVDLGGLVSGAGIAVLQTQSFADKSNAYLLAPRGTVDAGDAGIRVAGDLSILAVRVLNAYNIQVEGKTTGVPTVPVPNVTGLTAADNTAGAGTKTAAPTTTDPQQDRPSIIIVEVTGYGGGDVNPSSPPANRGDNDADEAGRNRKKPKPIDDRRSYNPNGNVRVLGYDMLGESEMIGLTDKEKQAIRN
jgi:filamentous hemagglutinin family protein